MNRERWCDTLKGVCITFVIITHSTWTAEERLRFGFPFWIAMAVPLFMLISGYVAAKSFERRAVANFRDAYAVDSIFDKWIRYTVPFAISYTAELILMDVFGVMQWPGIKTVLSDFQHGGYGPGSYYYPILLQLVFLFPLIFLITKFFVRRYPEHSAWVLLIWFAADLIYEFVAASLPIDADVYRLQIFRYLFLIAFGCYVGLGGRIKIWMSAMFAICGAAFVYLISYRNLETGFVSGWASTSALPALFILPLFYYLSRSSVSCKPFEWLGKASYNIFLVQMVWFQFEQLIIPLFPNRLLRLGVNLFVCTMVGIGFYYLEAPFTKWCIQKLHRLISLIEEPEKKSGS